MATPKPDGEGHIAVTGSVAFRSLGGVPKEATLRILRFLEAAATRADIALLNYEHAVGDYQLWGEIEVAEKEGKVELLYAWVAYDGHGQYIGKTSGKVAVSSNAGAGFWNGVPDRILETIANDGIAAVTKQSGSQTSASKPPRRSEANTDERLAEPPWQRGIAGSESVRLPPIP